MAEIVNLGSLYLNGQQKDLGVEYNGEVLSFGDTDPVKAIPFVKWGNLLVAARCVCTNISWNDLSHLGFIFGWPIKIDGDSYICRSLRVGEEEGSSNEWDAILDDLGESDDLWHWDHVYFWGQENEKNMASYCAIRGYLLARNWNYHHASRRLATVGFRPALEPLPPEPMISGALIGAGLKVYGPDADIAGELVEVTDYDLVMAPNAGLHLPRKCQWARRDGKRIIIDRTAVTWMKKEE